MKAVFREEFCEIEEEEGRPKHVKIDREEHQHFVESHKEQMKASIMIYRI